VKAGACSPVRVSATDLFPTFAELAGVRERFPVGIEGGSFANVLTNGGGGEVKRPRPEFVVHFPHYDKDAQGPAPAIYVGDLKLIRAYETGAGKLFDVAKDPGERRDLAAQLPEKAKELNQRLMDYLTAMNAQLPKLNPNCDPTKPTETTRGGGRRKEGQWKFSSLSRRFSPPASCWRRSSLFSPSPPIRISTSARTGSSTSAR